MRELNPAIAPRQVHGEPLIATRKLPKSNVVNFYRVADEFGCFSNFTLCPVRETNSIS